MVRRRAISAFCPSTDDATFTLSRISPHALPTGSSSSSILCESFLDALDAARVFENVAEWRPLAVCRDFTFVYVKPASPRLAEKKPHPFLFHLPAYGIYEFVSSAAQVSPLRVFQAPKFKRVIAEPDRRFAPAFCSRNSRLRQSTP